MHMLLYVRKKTLLLRYEQQGKICGENDVIKKID